MGFNDGHIYLEGAAIVANCEHCEVLTLMEPEAIATVRVLRKVF